MKARMQSERGYSLIEMMVSLTILMAVTGTIFSLVNPAQGISRTQPEYADMQQRARVGADLLTHELMMAGAGPYQGATTGSLLRYFAPIVPYRTGLLNPDPAGTYKDDTVSLIYVPRTSAQTSIANDMPLPSTELKVNAQPSCPNKGATKDPLCGFEIGMSVMLLDPQTGAWDSFEVTQTQSDAMHLQHRGQDLQEVYPTNSLIVEVQNHTYYWDRANLRLMHYDGLNTETPILDNVVGLNFVYYGDPNPPVEPKPALGVETCLFDALGNSRLAVLPSTTGSLVQLDPAIFRDGLPAWCGAGANQFDPDLFRIRQIEARIRVQAGNPALRPSANALAGSSAMRAIFAQPGTGVSASGGYVPDYLLRFEITPRNMNLGR